MIWKLAQAKCREVEPRIEQLVAPSDVNGTAFMALEKNMPHSSHFAMELSIIVKDETTQHAAVKITKGKEASTQTDQPEEEVEEIQAGREPAPAADEASIRLPAPDDFSLAGGFLAPTTAADEASNGLPTSTAPTVEDTGNDEIYPVGEASCRSRSLLLAGGLGGVVSDREVRAPLAGTSSRGERYV